MAARVNNREDSNPIIGFDEEHAVRKTAKQRAPNGAVNDPKGRRPLGDVFKHAIERVDEFDAETDSLRLVPGGSTSDIRFRARGNADFTVPIRHAGWLRPMALATGEDVSADFRPGTRGAGVGFVLGQPPIELGGEFRREGERLVRGLISD